MTPEEYCRNKAAPAGSNLYYCTLFHSAETRRKLHALFAFYHEINEVVYQSSDPGAARLTLHWWFEEIGRLFSDQARHPVAQELYQSETLDYLSKHEMLGCIAATAQLLDTPTTNDYATWLQQHSATSGYIWKTAGLVCDCTNQDDLAALVTSGCCYGAFELLHHVRHFAGLGLNILPAELLYRQGINLETIIRPGTDDARAEFFTGLFERLDKDLQDCLTNLQGEETNKVLFSITMLKILSALCREYQSTPQQVTHTRISLTPIRKLWIAWRTSRRLRR